MLKQGECAKVTERQCIQQEWDFLPSNAEIILDREDLTEWAVPEL